VVVLFRGDVDRTQVDDVSSCEFFVCHVLDGINGSGFRRREHEIPFEPDEFVRAKAD
jgi:hypothetical protein